MLLTGTFKRSLDDKLRLAIPKRFRDSFARKVEPEEGGKETDKKQAKDGQNPPLYIAPGTDGSLTLYTEESFTRLADQLSQASPTGKDVRAFSRLFFSRAECVDVDRQGRVRIPTELAQLATLGGEVMLIGVRDRMEIWSTEKWKQYMEVNKQEYDSLAEKAFDQRS